MVLNGKIQLNPIDTDDFGGIPISGNPHLKMYREHRWLRFMIKPRFQLPQSRFIAAVDPVIARAQHDCMGPPWIQQIHLPLVKDHLPRNLVDHKMGGDGEGQTPVSDQSMPCGIMHGMLKKPMRFGDIWKSRKYFRKNC